MKNNMDDQIDNFIEQLAKDAGNIVMKYYGKVSKTYVKKDLADIVTDADLESNKFICESIKSKFPDHGIISEEEGEHQINSEYCWIIDPLDGTRNFSTRTPLWGISIAYALRGVVIAGAIYDPVHDEFFFARKGSGAFRNKKKIFCSEKEDWDRSYGCATANFSKKKIGIPRALVKSASDKPIWVNLFASSVISAVYVADGRRDWYASANGEIWDFAAGSLILAESGCKVTNIENKSWKLSDKTLVAANKHLHPILLEHIKNQK